MQPPIPGTPGTGYQLRSTTGAAAARYQSPALLMAVLFGLWTFLPGCSKEEDQAALVLAQVGETIITAADLQAEVDRRKQAGRPVADKKDLLQEIVVYEALHQRALQAGLMTDPQIRREISNLLVGKLKDRELSPRMHAVEVTEAEVRAEYDKNRLKFTRPAKIRLAVLKLNFNSNHSAARRAEQRQRLEEAHRLTRQMQSATAKPVTGVAGLGFGRLSVDYSDDQASRYRGGDIGWLEPENFNYRWPREVLETGYALRKDEVSSIIETEEGLYLVMKTDTRQPRVEPYQKVKTSLRQGLLTKKRKELQRAFAEESVAQGHGKIDEAALASVQLRGLEQVVVKNQEPPSLTWPGTAN